VTLLDERKRTVRAAYDELGPRLGQWAEEIEGDPWDRFVEELVWMRESEGEAAFLWVLARRRP
jgi:hypothetical protein